MMTTPGRVGYYYFFIYAEFYMGVVTLVSLNLGFIVSVAITIETVFSIPGLGLLTTDALRIPDIPMLQGTFFVFSAAVVIANLVSNLLYGFLDPRVRL